MKNKLNICICQLIKDEQRYIEEWIDYYLNLGISYFVLFEDWNSTSHKDVLKKYGDKIILHRLLDIANDKEKEELKGNNLRQKVIWKIFYRLYKDKFDCCFFIDPDEFIECNKEQFFDEILEFASKEQYPQVKFIKYTWKIMTSNGYIKDPAPNKKYSIINTYTEPLKEDYKEYINRCNRQLHNHEEIDDYNLNTKNLIYLYKLDSYKDFKDIPHNVFTITDYVLSDYKLRHYPLKSFEEFTDKIFNKGEQIDASFSRKLDFFFKINKDLISKKNELIKPFENIEYKYNTY